ncbi:MAG: peptide chain release factor N(5)-glutamine methyltransferase [Clostridia bacterium]|nr:peptide chain release factor N(5)-glutamine methyltransferase [Clostridia bacterium]
MSFPIRELIKMGISQLERAGIDNAEGDAKDLLCFVKHIDGSKLRLIYQYESRDEDCQAYFELLDRRSAGEPLQYITGVQNFYGRDFEVNENVLIPRLDTEVVVEEAIKLLKDMKNAEVLDLCTGSGAIAITIAKECGKNVKVSASDLSDRALETAAKNSGLLEADVKFYQSDMFSAFKGKISKKKFDMIVSNPPYIESAVIPTLQREVKDHEPMMALNGGEDGLDYYRIIADEAANHLKKDGLLVLEIGYDQGTSVPQLLEESGRFTEIKVLKDLAGLDRVISAKLARKSKGEK